MATVDGKTSAKVDQLLDATIVNGQVDQSSKHLILTTRGGTSIDAGSLASGRLESWLPTITYQAGDIVGYAGSVWKALTDNGNKCPGLNATEWLRVTGSSYDVWSEKDPYFESSSLNDAWSIGTSSGGVVSLSTTPADRETGRQSLKVSLPAAGAFACRPLEENLIRGGETIIVSIRIKLSAAVSGVTCEAVLSQNDNTGGPYPAEPGVTNSNAGPQGVTATWQTLNYTFTSPSNSKPRANIYISIVATGSNAIVLVDRIRISRTNVVLQAWPVGSIFMSTSPTNPASLLGGGTWAAWGQGRVVVGVDSTQTEFDTVEETGGEKTHLITVAEVPLHSHSAGFLTTSSAGGHTHDIAFQYNNNTTTGGGVVRITDIRNITGGGGTAATATTATGGDHAHPVTGTTGLQTTGGTGQATNNLQPYITAYFWKRTA